MWYLAVAIELCGVVLYCIHDDPAHTDQQMYSCMHVVHWPTKWGGKNVWTHTRVRGEGVWCVWYIEVDGCSHWLATSHLNNMQLLLSLKIILFEQKQNMARGISTMQLNCSTRYFFGVHGVWELKGVLVGLVCKSVCNKIIRFFCRCIQVVYMVYYNYTIIIVGVMVIRYCMTVTWHPL